MTEEVRIKVGLKIVKRNKDGSEEVVYERGFVEPNKYSEKGGDPNVTADIIAGLAYQYFTCYSCGSGYVMNASGYAYDTNNNQYQLSNVSAQWNASNNTLTLQGSLTPSTSVTIASLSWVTSLCIAPQYTPNAPAGIVCPITTNETITSVNASLNANTTYTFILTISLSVPTSF
jgi:hypothetical protein